ncbi:MAG: CHAT domain-containing protein [Ignavibacteriaceae bacterium]|nr:CHAT domain-containing protein [Ignavibacteriaceae bacterium]
MNFKPIYITIIFCLLVPFTLVAQTDSVQVSNQYTLADTVKGIEYFNIGKSFIDKAKYNSSVTAFTEAEKIYTSLLQKNEDRKLWLKLIQVKNYLGFNLCYLSRYTESIKYLTEANKLCKEKLGEENKTAAQIYQSLGIYYDFTADLDSSLLMFGKALEIRKKLLGEDHSDVADTYNSIGIIYSKRSNFDNALEYFNKSLQIKRKVLGEEHPHTATAYNNIGINLFERGDFYKALEYYNQALKIRLKTIGEQHHLTASSYNNIGNCLNEIGEFDKAEQNHLKTLAIQKTTLGEDHDLVATSLSNLGLTCWRKNELVKALEYLNKSLALRLKKPKSNYTDIAMDYLNIGVVYKTKNELDSALYYYNKALEIYNSIGYLKVVNVSKIYQNISEGYFAKQKYDSSLAAIQKSMQAIVYDFNDDNIQSNPNFDLILSEVHLLNSLKIKSKNYSAIASANTIGKNEKIKNYLEAIKVTELADSLINRMLGGFKNDNSKFFLGEKAKSIFEQGIEASYNLFKLTGDTLYLEKIFYFIEKSKAAVLRQGLLESKAKQYSKISDEILKQEKILKDDLIFYETRLKNELSKKENHNSLVISEYQDKIFELKNSFDKLIASIEKENPSYYKLKYNTNLFALYDIQKSLSSNSLLVDYFIGENTIYIAAVNNSRFNIIAVAKPSNFNQIVMDFYSSIQKAETNNFITNANKLTEILIQPIYDEISVSKNITIIPHDILFKLPFEALFAKKQNVSLKKQSDLDFLIKHFNISYHYSASLFVESQSRTDKNASKNFIGFAPIFPKEKLSGYTITNNISNLLASNDNVLRSVSVDGKSYDELKYSEWEVNSIIDLFNKDNSSSVNTAYFYADAKEDSFKANVKDYKIVHIASHSFMNEDQPDISGVIFAQPQDSVFINDGILYAGETYNLDLNADLVVLSSCESGLGKLFKGEGMIGLTRGFLYSGTNNIIFSLWKISDKHTSELMVEFYKQTILGKDYSEALRQAKLKLISNELTARPRSWAGFLLIGAD